MASTSRTFDTSLHRKGAQPLSARRSAAVAGARAALPKRNWRGAQQAKLSAGTPSSVKVTAEMATDSPVEEDAAKGVPGQTLGSMVMQKNEAEDAKWTMPPVEERPGATDSQYFEEDASVDFWKNYQPLPEGATVQDFLNKLQTELDAVRKEYSNVEDLPYWTYHVFRSSFFTLQGAAAVIAAQVQNQASFPTFKDAEGNLDPGIAATAAGRLWLEALATFRQDYANIKAGAYKQPYDMEPSHRQFNPLFVLGQANRYIAEAVGTLDRRDKNASTDVWNQDSKLYPRYFRHTFHYQRDGWFSRESAKVYDTSTETLFVGRQDAMQRHTLVPFAKFMEGRDEASTKVLEVACGTGRFHTFLRDSFPALQTVASDLSPFYLAEARDAMGYWEKFRGDEMAAKGSTSFVQANGEDLPWEDESFDAVLNVYLFHELPLPARKNVIKEVARVLKPGGLFVLTDSIQLGDRPVQDDVIGNFGNFAEPHYRGFIRTDFGALCKEYGLEPQWKATASSSKTLSFVKSEQRTVDPTVVLVTDSSD